MKSITERLDEGLADLAWSLWTNLGVAGVFRRHGKCLILLEELIILTSVIGNSDPRLREEALDWCSRYHHLVSISRLKTLVKKMGVSVVEPFSVFASTINTISQSNWPIFSDVKPLKLTPRGKSSLPLFDSPALLQFRLRAFFGVGARADLFTYFLTESKGDFTAVEASEIGYNKRSLADLLDQLVNSGFLSSSIIRNQKKYKIIKDEELKRIVGKLPEVAPPWPRILEFLISLRYDLQGSENNTNATNVMRIRSDLAKMKNLLSSLHLSPPSLGSDPYQYWEQFSRWLLDYVKAIAQGNFEGQFQVNSHFEKASLSFLQYLHKVEDCLDGLEYTFNYSKGDLVKHSQIYKETYQLGLVYVNDLKDAMQKLLDFPFYQLMDDKISEMQYEYSKNKFPSFLSFVEKYILVNQVATPRQALNQYELLQSKLNNLHNFVFNLRDRLKEIQSSEGEPSLPSLTLTKRHAVMRLYSP